MYAKFPRIGGQWAGSFINYTYYVNFDIITKLFLQSLAHLIVIKATVKFISNNVYWDLFWIMYKLHSFCHSYRGSEILRLIKSFLNFFCTFGLLTLYSEEFIAVQQRWLAKAKLKLRLTNKEKEKICMLAFLIIQLSASITALPLCPLIG